MLSIVRVVPLAAVKLSPAAYDMPFIFTVTPESIPVILITGTSVVVAETSEANGLSLYGGPLT